MTVASLATITTSRPQTRPMPVTMPAGRRLVVVEIPGGEGGELEEGGARVEEPVDALADGQLALLAMPLHVPLPPAAPDQADPFPQLGDQAGEPRTVRAKQVRVRVDVSLDDIHGGGRLLLRKDGRLHQPQQSVL